MLPTTLGGTARVPAGQILNSRCRQQKYRTNPGIPDRQELAEQPLRTMKPHTIKGPSRGLSRAARIGTAVALTAALSMGAFAPAAMAATDDYGREVTARTSAAQPAVLGMPYYGVTLNVDPGTWNEPVSIQWLRDGKPVDSEVFYAYTVSKDDLGKSISVRVTGDYSKKVRTSGSTAKASYTPIANTGAPVITGNPVSGSVLTASAGTWTQKGVTLGYQWMRNGQNIKDATTRTYTVSGQDKGGRLSVAVTASKKDFQSASAKSEQSAPAVYPDMKTSTPQITGNTAIGQKLTAVPGSWTEGAQLSYLWKREGLKVGTDSTYVLTENDEGFSLTVTVTGTKSMYNSGSETSAITAEIGAAIISNTARPSITGTAVEGRTLTASAGSWSPSEAKLGFQWLRDDQPVQGAEGRTYKLTAEDVGSVISVRVEGTMDGYKSGSGVSAGTVKVLLPMVTGTTPVVTGTPEVSRTLTAEPGKWQDGADMKYQWLANGVPVAGANDTTFVLGKNQIGKKMTFSAVGTKDKHRARTAVSAATAPVTDLVVVNIQAPSIAGTAMEGSALRVANAGTWGPGTVNLGYQWLRDGKAVSGADKAEYQLTQEDVGAVMSLRVSGTKDGYESRSVTTAGTVRVLDLAVTGPVPTVSGSATAGHTVTAKIGTWTKDAKIEYQWLRNGAPIPGAVKAEYTLGNADVGTRLAVRVTGTKDGYTQAQKTSAETGKAYRGWIEATKTAWVWGGQMDGYTLSAKDVAYNTGGADLSFQWLRDGAAIAGANGFQYVLTGSDVGKVISVRITATKLNYRPLTVTTAGTNPIVNSPIMNTAKPTITGKGTVGSVMSADPGQWNHPGLSFTYQWYANGKEIPGANRPGYRATQEKRGMQLTVKVTAKKSKFTSGAAVSDATAKIQ